MNRTAALWSWWRQAVASALPLPAWRLCCEAARLQRLAWPLQEQQVLLVSVQSRFWG